MGTPLVLDDRVLVTTTTPGTGSYELGSAVSAAWSPPVAIPNGSRVPYTVVDSLTAPTQFEVGEGVYTSSGTTLSRALIHRSSSGGAAINWPGTGTRYLFIAVPAIRTPILDTDGLLPATMRGPPLFARFASSSAVSAPNNTAAAVPFNLRTTDTLGGTSGSGPWYGVTNPTAAPLGIIANGNWAPSTAGTYRAMEIVIDGVIVSRDWQPAAGGTHNHLVAYAALIAAGASISVQVIQNTGGALNFGNNALCNLMIWRL